MKYEYNGQSVLVNIIGGFRIEELNKEYVMCSFDDNPSSKTVEVIILEIKDDEGTKQLVDIPKEETEMVLLFYKSLKKELLKGDND